MGQAAPGGGDMLHEFDAFCVAPESRMKRMEEAIEVMRLLTSEENVSYHGEYNDFDNVTIEPRSVQRPIPIWVTSNPRPNLTRNREAGLRRTARLGDGWMTTFQPPAIIEAYMADIRRYAEEEGRELPDDFEVCVYYNINVNDNRRPRWTSRGATSRRTTTPSTRTRCSACGSRWVLLSSASQTFSPMSTPVPRRSRCGWSGTTSSLPTTASSTRCYRRSVDLSCFAPCEHGGAGGG